MDAVSMQAFVTEIQNTSEEAERRDMMVELASGLIYKVDVSLNSQKIHFSAEMFLRHIVS